MLDTLLAFLPVAAVLTVTPGVATALVVRAAARGGRREALLVTVGNSLGVLAWAVFAAIGVAAAVAASASLFTTIKLAGAVVLVILGVQGLLGRRAEAPPPPPGAALRVGLVTSLANPKLAVFFVALFPQFVPAGAPVLGTALLMAATIVALDVVWYGALSAAVIRVRRGVIGRRVAAWLERATGAVLIVLGVRVALDAR